MKTELEALRTASLTNLEAGQLIERHITDIGKLDQSKLTDASLKTYLGSLQTKSNSYEDALLPIRKSDLTLKIEAADAERDIAIAALGKAINLSHTSDVAAEADAGRSLQIVFDTYKNLSVLTYEAETIGIDNLVADLTSPKYAVLVTTLVLDRYITRLTTANDNFKQLFGGRMQESSSKENFDAKTLRKDLFTTYDDFANYVLSQAKAPATAADTQFTNVLNVLNTARKYYADMLAKRAGKNAAAVIPAATPVAANSTQ